MTTNPLSVGELQEIERRVHWAKDRVRLSKREAFGLIAAAHKGIEAEEIAWGLEHGSACPIHDGGRCNCGLFELISPTPGKGEATQATGKDEAETYPIRVTAVFDNEIRYLEGDMPMPVAASPSEDRGEMESVAEEYDLDPIGDFEKPLPSNTGEEVEELPCFCGDDPGRNPSCPHHAWQPAAVKRLEQLCHPMAEAMSDGARLDAFVRVGLEIVDLLSSLTEERDRLKRHEQTALDNGFGTVSEAVAAAVINRANVSTLRNANYWGDKCCEAEKQIAEAKADNERLREALGMTEGALLLLGKAIAAKDPISELLLRVTDIRADLKRATLGGEDG